MLTYHACLSISGRVALDDYVDLVAKLKGQAGGVHKAPVLPGKGTASGKRAVIGGATESSSHTIDQEECVHFLTKHTE